jgi:hypothetical protein
VEAYHQGEDSYQVEGTVVGKTALVVGRAVRLLLLAGEGILVGMGTRDVVDYINEGK